MTRWIALAMLASVACGGAADGGASEPGDGAETPTDIDSPAEPACFWGQPEACEPCSGNRDYGPDNTCTDVAWRGRSDTDFCLLTYPCNAPAQPVTRLEREEETAP